MSLNNPGREEGKAVSEQHIIRTQAYEITTKVGADVDSKGYVKPTAEVRITRYLESGDEISDLIHADISRGVEECMVAITDIQKRGVKA